MRVSEWAILCSEHPTDQCRLENSLTPDQWSSVYGKTGNYDATALAGFRDALANLGHIGMTFGGGCFFGHGVNVSGGTARFVLIGYTIS